ncbi:hypothetical protein [Flagellimonas pacifica]|uniref:Uncharacterized protein n=1 Tax=Flagellimonas pacifica TaxID=1247520 RepID=A0A285MET9_9FLAO|nr:hypothetical protein [Allomuricauda parva]SNY94977.1 hypothetical protein SAMN06265377_0640 [Allomuricauda parva]
MLLKSNFKSDLAKEKRLSALLDSYYQKHLRSCHFERVRSMKEQLMGIDLVLQHKTSLQTFYVDEKAQLDYVNETLPTFAFELCYLKNGIEKPGWLFDQAKNTHFYALITSIFSDEDEKYTSCNITFVNRKKLLSFLEKRGLTQSFLKDITSSNKGLHGKLVLDKINPKTEGYLFFSRKNKAENPVNLILKLAFLCKVGIAKRLV